MTTMKPSSWKRLSDHAMKNGQWTVCKASVLGQWKYVLTKDGTDLRVNLNSFDEVKEYVRNENMQEMRRDKTT